MKRDGYNKSLWQQAPGIKVNFATNPGQCDIVIAGGGITGLSLALQLQRGGKKCLIAEARSLGFGTTSGTTAHINTIFDTSYKQLIKDFGKENARKIADLSVNALSFIENNVKDLEIDCGFEYTNSFTFAENDEQEKVINEIFEGSKEVGLEVIYSDKLPVQISFTKAVKASGQAKFNPAQYITALSMAFEAAGGMILENCLVEDVKEADGKVTVTTGLGNIECTQFVWATHTTPGINLLSFRLAPYRSYVIVAELEDEGQQFKELLYDGGDPYHYYRMQKVEGINYLIAGGEDHKTGHEENTEVCFDKLIIATRKNFNIKKVTSRWSSQYYEPVDGIPYIGKMPGSENIFTACGFSGNGITYAAISAIILGELLLTGESEAKDLFSPSRLKPVAGFTNFVKENADVVVEMVSGWFSAEKMDSFADMVPGEGRVVKYDSHKMGVYKNEDGQLFCVNTTCPHAGCTIAWNNSEKSWDCPCHGARYDKDGSMLNGPAVKGLEKVVPEKNAIPKVH